MVAFDAQLMLGVVLLATQAMIAAPVLTSALRARSVTGYSIAGEATWAVAGLGWALYGVLTRSPVLAASGMLAAVTSAFVTTLAVRRGHMVRSAVVAIVVTATVLAAGAALAGGEIARGLGAALAVVGVVQFLPQILTSIRVRMRAIPTPGVSTLGALLRSMYCLAWAAFAAAWALWDDAGSIDVPLTIWGLCGAFAFALQAVITTADLGEGHDARG